MARRRVKGERRSRDLSTIAKVAVLSSLLSSRALRSPPPSVLSEYSDLRRYNPTRSVVAPFAFRSGDVRLIPRAAIPSARPARVARHASLPVRVGFAVPSRVAICIRRHRRREVLMAYGLGGGHKRKPRRNFWSDVRC